MTKKTVITARTSVEVELKHEACAFCKYVKNHVRREQKRQLDANQERYATIYRTNHGQIQEKSDMIRMVIALPKSMVGKTATFELESAEMCDVLHSIL